MSQCNLSFMHDFVQQAKRPLRPVALLRRKKVVFGNEKVFKQDIGSIVCCFHCFCCCCFTPLSCCTQNKAKQEIFQSIELQRMWLNLVLSRFPGYVFQHQLPLIHSLGLFIGRQHSLPEQSQHLSHARPLQQHQSTLWSCPNSNGLTNVHRKIKMRF